jgi:hypothetical protein
VGNQYRFTFNTLGFSDGDHTLTTHVYDPDGNFAADSRMVVFDNYAIFCTITYPNVNTPSISGTITVNASVPGYTTKAELYVDGVQYAINNSISATWVLLTLNTANFKDGKHTLTVIAYDPDGNTASSSTGVTIKNYQVENQLYFSQPSPFKNTVSVWIITQSYATRAEYYINDVLTFVKINVPSGGGWILFTFNLDKSKELLAKVGLSGGFDLPFVTSQALPGMAKMAQIIQSDLAKVNIRAKIEEIESAEQSNRLINRKYTHAWTLSFGFNNLHPSTMPTVAYPWRVGLNSSYYENPEYKELVEKLRVTTDETQAKQLAGRLTDHILDASFVLPVTPQKRMWAMHASVKQVAYSQEDALFLENAWMDR